LQQVTRLSSAIAIALTVTLGVGGAALADGGYPTQQQVDQARQHVTETRTSLGSARAAYTRATTAADRAEQQAEIASEAYNGAMWRLSLARTATRKAVAAATAAQAKVRDQRIGIADLVVRSYQDGAELNELSAFLNSGGPTEALENAGVVNMAGDSLKADYDRYVQLSDAADAAQQKAATAEQVQEKNATAARAARASAAAAAAHAETLAHDAAARRNALVKTLATAEHTSIALANKRQAALEAIARKKAEEAAKRAAAAAAKKAAAEQAAANAQGSGDENGGPADVPSSLPVPSSGAVAAAIAYAKAQLGKPYLWAAAGPSRFDCSGLTMMAWREGGISLPHFSGAQYDAGTPIPVSQARPGDLYFWSYNGRPSGIHHVALALGDGAFIEAPHTGADVRYNNVSAWYPNFAVRL